MVPTLRWSWDGAHLAAWRRAVARYPSPRAPLKKKQILKLNPFPGHGLPVILPTSAGGLYSPMDKALVALAKATGRLWVRLPLGAFFFDEKVHFPKCIPFSLLPPPAFLLLVLPARVLSAPAKLESR
jgi:hypothetical protein